MNHNFSLELTSNITQLSKVLEQIEHLKLEFGVVSNGNSFFTIKFSLELKLLRIISLSHDLFSYTLSFGSNLTSSELVVSVDVAAG